MDSQAIISGLESKIDQLESELCYLHSLLIQAGFDQGVISLKEACQEYISNFL